MDDIASHSAFQYVLESFASEVEAAGDITNDSSVRVGGFDEFCLGVEAAFLFATADSGIADDGPFGNIDSEVSARQAVDSCIHTSFDIATDRLRRYAITSSQLGRGHPAHSNPSKP